VLPSRGVSLRTLRQAIAQRAAPLRHPVRTVDDVLIAVERLRRLVHQSRDAPADTDLLLSIREELDDLSAYFR
jgi:hypothetical protein